MAEGIETMDQLRWLQEQGCDVGQGHLFCHALGREELLAWLRTGAILNQPACADTCGGEGDWPNPPDRRVVAPPIRRW